MKVVARDKRKSGCVRLKMIAYVYTYACDVGMNDTPLTLDQFLETDFFKVLAEPARLRLIQLL